MNKKEKSGLTDLNWRGWVLFIGSIIGLVFGAFYVFTNGLNWGSGFNGKADFANYFNAILGPFVGFVGIVLTFLAFYVQYRANKAITSQQRIDRFEQRFFELLRIHRENSILLTVSRPSIEPQQSFGTKTFNIGKQEDPKYTSLEGEALIFNINREIRLTNRYIRLIFESEITGDSWTEFEIFDLSYQVCYWGSEAILKRGWKNSRLGKILDLTPLKVTCRSFSKGRDFMISKAGDKSHQISAKFDYGPITNAPLMLQGYSQLLSKYFRHLFQTFRHLDEFSGNGFDLAEQRNYGRLLRAQLSSEEISLLYFNSLAVFGAAWWEKGFIEKYRLLKNIHIDDIPLEISPKLRMEQYFTWKKQDLSSINWGTYFDALG